MLHCSHSPGITGARSRWRRRLCPTEPEAGFWRAERGRTRAQRAGVVGKGVPKSPKGEASGESERVGGRARGWRGTPVSHQMLSGPKGY